jgi:hypothetical protein
MKVAFCKSVDVESEVNIDVDDITTALQESLNDAELTRRHAGESPRFKTLTVWRFVSSVYQCLKGVTDEMIESIPENNRKIIADAIREQADRYHNP